MLISLSYHLLLAPRLFLHCCYYCCCCCYYYYYYYYYFFCNCNDYYCSIALPLLVRLLVLVLLIQLPILLVLLLLLLRLLLLLTETLALPAGFVFPFRAQGVGCVMKHDQEEHKSQDFLNQTQSENLLCSPRLRRPSSRSAWRPATVTRPAERPRPGLFLDSGCSELRRNTQAVASLVRALTLNSPEILTLLSHKPPKA